MGKALVYKGGSAHGRGDLEARQAACCSVPSRAGGHVPAVSDFWVPPPVVRPRLPDVEGDSVVRCFRIPVSRFRSRCLALIPFLCFLVLFRSSNSWAFSGSLYPVCLSPCVLVSGFVWVSGLLSLGSGFGILSVRSQSLLLVGGRGKTTLHPSWQNRKKGAGQNKSCM